MGLVVVAILNGSLQLVQYFRCASTTTPISATSICVPCFCHLQPLCPNVVRTIRCDFKMANWITLAPDKHKKGSTEQNTVKAMTTASDAVDNKSLLPPSDTESMLQSQVLIARIAEFENSVYHLTRSNTELREADPAGIDKDFADAVAENEDVIQRRKVEIRKHEKQLEEHGWSSGAIRASVATLLQGFYNRGDAPNVVSKADEAIAPTASVPSGSGNIVAEDGVFL
jgi:hypothetical protein